MSDQKRHELASAKRRTIGTGFLAKCSCGRRFTGDKRDKAKALAERHAAKANGTACPRPDKVGYRSEAEALRNIPQIWAGSPTAHVLRPYECRCRGWHLSSKPNRDEQ